MMYFIQVKDKRLDDCKSSGEVPQMCIRCVSGRRRAQRRVLAPPAAGGLLSAPSFMCPPRVLPRLGFPLASGKHAVGRIYDSEQVRRMGASSQNGVTHRMNPLLGKNRV